MWLVQYTGERREVYGILGAGVPDVIKYSDMLAKIGF